MACNGALTTPTKIPPTTVTPLVLVLKFFNPPPIPPNLQTFLLPPKTGNKDHEDVKLMDKTLVQHICQQIKHQNKV